MATQDISRHLFRPANYYLGARAQQGRVLLDSDINEGKLLDNEAQRVVVVDVVGEHGSADAGFTIANVPDGVYDFDILAGSYFLGGMRHEIASENNPAAPQKFTAQSDWRQQNRIGEQPAPPILPAAPRHDLVYLVGWEQTVCAIEDGELFEPMLAGLDTGVSTRNMHRVYVLPDVDDDGVAAFDELVDTFTDVGHAFDADNHELKSAARLTVTFASAPAEDLCGASAPSYAGSENQAIRIQLVESNRFLWALDNASPLYRVSVVLAESTATITFLTPPREQANFPLVGQVVELLPWGARLPSGEHVAAHRIAGNIGGGAFGRVTTTYNPRTKQLVATITDPTTLANMNLWFGALPADKRYFFLRTWNSDGAPVTGVGTEFTPGTGLFLPTTGMLLTFSHVGIPGDYWILAARHTGLQPFVPWPLSPAAPHGPRRFYSPLALLHWTMDGMTPVADVESCRRTFHPLTRLGGCCTVTVGDGATSFGDYRKINDAILALPTDRPGKICVLPGTYEELVIIEQRQDIVIEGCGPRTIIRTPTGNPTSDGLVTLKQCKNLTLRSLAIEADGQAGVSVLGGPAPPQYAQQITLDRLVITTRRDPLLPPAAVADLGPTATSARFPLPTLYASGVTGLRVLDCTCTMIGSLGGYANIFLMYSQKVVVRECAILTPPDDGITSRAWGGLHVGGGCNDVLVERCEIFQGLGYGITLGSVSGGPPPQPGEPADPNSGVDDDECPTSDGTLKINAVESGIVVPVTPLSPENIRILNNRIHGMGNSGISVLGFFAESVSTVPQIRTDRLLIARNKIENNYTHPALTLPDPIFQSVVAAGGIILADADHLRIHDNIIQGNGVDHIHATCGIYVLRGENIIIENNTIQKNGVRVAGSGSPGNRAGIALQFVGRAIVTDNELSAPADAMLPAARVRGNIVVQPAGRALQMYGLGAMFIEGNTLVSQGLDGISPSEAAYAAHCVEILNLGQSPDLVRDDVVPALIAIFPLPQFQLEDPDPNPTLVDGRILFTDNQVRFNPVQGRSGDVFCATRLQSYGDIAVLDNQFLAKFPNHAGSMLYDTIVTGYSVRVAHNRWEDPIKDALRNIITTVSAITLGHINFTVLNQASRCIHVTDAGDWDDSDNQVVNADACSTAPPLEDYFADPSDP